MRMCSAITAVTCAAMAPGIALSSAADATPAGSGAGVVVQQSGVTTHRVCANEDVWLAADGFAPKRRVVQTRVQIVGSGVLFDQTIKLTGGAGTANTGAPGSEFIGLKFRVRYQTGSSNNTSNNGSFSATIVDC